MSQNLFQPSWPSFLLDETLFDLGHLDEHRLVAEDSEGNKRLIIVTFSDHCFTDKTPEDPLKPQKFLYHPSTRKPGYFCRRRYDQSLMLVHYIEDAKTRSVWNASGQNRAIIPTVTDNGVPAHYAILFNLRRWKGTPPYHLRMDILSAYICDEISQFVTFGEIGFKKLISLTMKNRQPTRNTNSGRKRPK